VEFEGERVRILKVGDFGLAQKVVEPLFTRCGSPPYVAPEILTGVGYGLKVKPTTQFREVHVVYWLDGKEIMLRGKH
jgi:serine/threonine protein kinase